MTAAQIAAMINLPMTAGAAVAVINRAARKLGLGRRRGRYCVYFDSTEIAAILTALGLEPSKYEGKG